LNDPASGIDKRLVFAFGPGALFCKTGVPRLELLRRRAEGLALAN
jgi:hypothetical protein